MGREIRRVPPDWKHPRRDTDGGPGRTAGDFRPLRDEFFDAALERWYAEWQSWRAATHPHWRPGCRYDEWAGGPPDPDHYRHRDWTEAEATHCQMYETVSEGTPVSPVFATPEGLVEYLVAGGDFWDRRRGSGGWARAAAEAFVRAGSAPSLRATRTKSGLRVVLPRDEGMYGDT